MSQIADLAAARQARRHNKRSDYLFNLRRGELIRLFRKRLGDEPNKQQLQEAIWNAVGVDPMTLTATELGERVRLTGWEKIMLDIRTMMPIDATAEDLKIFYRERKRQRDRVRARERRQERKMAITSIPIADQRVAKVSSVLKRQNTTEAKRWMTVEMIAANVKKYEAFAGLKPVSLRCAIHKAIVRLSKDGKIEQDAATGKNSLPLMLVRWTGFGDATRSATVVPLPQPYRKPVASPNDPHEI